MVAAALCYVDCSSNNGTPDLAAYAKAGHRHIALKVSEGTGYHWPQFGELADQAHALGLRIGAYHWLTERVSAAKQARWFTDLAAPHLRPDDWLMTDFEQTSGVKFPGDAARAKQLTAFNADVAKTLPTFPLYVYTGNWYLDGRAKCQTAVRAWPVVMSDYSGTKTLPNEYRLCYAAWQYTDTATVPGFTGHVDYNRWLEEPMTEAQFTAWMTAWASSAAGKKALGDAVWMTMYKPSTGKVRKLRSMKWWTVHS